LQGGVLFITNIYAHLTIVYLYTRINYCVNEEFGVLIGYKYIYHNIKKNDI